VTRECHAGILWEPGGEIPPGHPTDVLRPRPSVTEKFEFIDAEYAAYQVCTVIQDEDAGVVAGADVRA
jgi:hypothetical protein